MGEAQQSYPYAFRVLDHKWVVGAATVISMLAALLAVLAVRALLLELPSAAIVLAAPMAIAGALLCWTVALRRAVVWPDRIEVSNGFRNQILKAESIRGYRRQNDRWIALVPWQGSLVWIPPSTWSVQTRVPWMMALPDLTLEPRRTIERKIASDPRHGATHLDRQLLIAEIKRWAFWLNAITGVVGLACFFLPFKNFAIAAAGAATALSLAFVACSRGLARIDMADDADDPRPALWLGAILPWFFVVVNTEHANGKASLFYAGLGGVAYAGLLALNDEHLRSKPTTAAMVAAGVALYFWTIAAHWTP